MPHLTSTELLSREEGRQEGRMEGRLEALRENILEVLRARFEITEPEIAARIETISNEAGLRELLHHAARVSSLSDFKQRLFSAS